jgi:hypothetical protein
VELWLWIDKLMTKEREKDPKLNKNPKKKNQI